MARTETVTITNMGMVYEGSKVLIQDIWYYFTKLINLKEHYLHLMKERFVGVIGRWNG